MSHHALGPNTRLRRALLDPLLPLAVAVLAWLLPCARSPRDRGDVPGWVLITVMTAGLVSALWLFAGTALIDMFKSAISSVSGR